MADGRGLLIGLALTATAVVVGSVVMADKNAGKKSPPPSTADQCAALAKAAAPLLTSATAADVPDLTALLAKAQALGADCGDLVSQIQQKLKDLGSKPPVITPAPGPATPSALEGYSVWHPIATDFGVGGIASADGGDMLIVPIQEKASGVVYITPLSYSGDSGASAGPATYEKTLADIALAKYQAVAKKNGFDPAGPLAGSVGSVVVGAPAGLKDGTVFTVKFVSSAGPSDPIYVVTSAQMKSDIGGEASPPASTIGWDEAFGPKKDKTTIDVYSP